MKFKLTAGAEIDLPTADEIRQVLRSWHLEAMRGLTPKRFAGQGDIANSAVTVQDGPRGTLGPEAGMAWLVSRVAVSGLTPATDPTALYVGDSNSPWNLLVPSLTGVSGATGYHEFPSGQVLLVGNDRLTLQSTGAIASTGTVTLTGQAWEAPMSLLWRLVT